MASTPRTIWGTLTSRQAMSLTLSILARAKMRNLPPPIQVIINAHPKHAHAARKHRAFLPHLPRDHATRLPQRRRPIPRPRPAPKKRAKLTRSVHRVAPRTNPSRQQARGRPRQTPRARAAKSVAFAAVSRRSTAPVPASPTSRVHAAVLRTVRTITTAALRAARTCGTASTRPAHPHPTAASQTKTIRLEGSSGLRGPRRSYNEDKHGHPERAACRLLQAQRSSSRRYFSATAVTQLPLSGPFSTSGHSSISVPSSIRGSALVSLRFRSDYR